MKKYSPFLVFIFILHFTSIHAQGFSDKTKHFGAGFVIGGIGGYTANKMFDGNRYWTWAGAIGGSLAAGLSKEAYDGANGGLVETRDVVYTTLGGVVSGMFLELLLNKNKRNRRGKNCGCLVVDVDAEQYQEEQTIYIENGSRDIASAIQATSIYSNY